ncbi:hypothetical protein [Aeromonas encheleia]|uniref:Uncharacterized protein n=1 Tax=Aeromonas encheleia TaxID=73010 RepID=A0AAE9SAT3_9GAMM|nr:hypothetical protein [Aeromonas encheleia]USV56045.1 hypothetical protein NHF51_11775 [Aeromonas encheleia]
MLMGMAMLVSLFMMVLVLVLVAVVMGVRVMMPVSLAGLHSAHPVVVVMDIPLMVVVVVNDQGARRWLPMSVLMVVIVAVLGMMLVFVLVFMFMIVPGDSCLAASAYATHINLPRCR